jgi:hypothetical protein
MNTLSINRSFASFSAAIILFACAPLGRLSASSSFDEGTPTSHTPYDAYLTPVWSVFGHLGDNQPDIYVVEGLLQQGHSFRYVFNSAQPYQPQTPEQTEQTHSGDCKAKSLWLAYKMSTRKVIYVIGKARAVSTMSHAWLVWQSPNGWLILDATNFSQPLSFGQISPTEFIPLYSFSSSGKYVHSVAAAGHATKYADHL